jgi:Cu2+-exporting ATPase
MASISACPACDAAPLAIERAKAGMKEGDQTFSLSLPTIHCAGCIASVERALQSTDGVVDARVNLTLKRATVTAAHDLPLADVVAVLERAGYEAHELDTTQLTQTENDRRGRELLMRLAVAGFAMMNVMLLSIAVWSGAEDTTRDMFHWISAMIAIPATLFAGTPFFVNAWAALRHGRLNMDVPITLAIGLALLTSLWETILSGEHAYFDAAIALTFFLLAGRYLDYRTRTIAKSAAQELSALEVERATRIKDGEKTEVSVATLAIGDLIYVAAGARIPVDGVVSEGQSELDRSLLTGETKPEQIAPAGVVQAGEVNLTGPLVIRATAVGQDTSLHKLAELVAVAESGRAQYTPIADQAAKLYAPGVHILAALAFVGWYLYTFDFRTATNIAAAVLIITCPCALGLAVPAVTTAASGRLFQRGLLIKNATALERLSHVDWVVFDKTGTLTTGLAEVENLDAYSDDILTLVLGLAQNSPHPMAQSLATAIRARGHLGQSVDAVQERPGFGTEGIWNGQPIKLGRAEWFGIQAGFQTASWFQIADQAPIAFFFKDEMRDGAKEVVAKLVENGTHVAILSGDAEHPVAHIAQELGVKTYRAAARPEDKVAFVQNLQAEGHHVLMVGDGLNDTAALSTAHVSISPARALDAARVASDIVLLNASLTPVFEAIVTGRLAQKRIKENFSIATIYNVIAVPIAVAGLASPFIAALAMSFSSITVSLNALRLR